MKSIKEIYQLVIESLITERLLNKDIEQRIKTDKNYNPSALSFYKFLKTKNVSYEFFHGTSGVAYEMMKKDGFISSPHLRGTGDLEQRKGNWGDLKYTGIDQIYFTTDFTYANMYAEREIEKFRNNYNEFDDFLKSIKNKYNFSDEFIKEHNIPVILTIKVPLYLLTEVNRCIYSEKYRNELGMDIKISKIILNEKITNEEKLSKLLKYIDSTKKQENEFTVIGLLPVDRIKGYKFINIGNKEEMIEKLIKTNFNKFLYYITNDAEDNTKEEIIKKYKNEIGEALKKLVKKDFEAFFKFISYINNVDIQKEYFEKFKNEIEHILQNLIESNFNKFFNFICSIKNVDIQKQYLEKYKNKIENILQNLTEKEFITIIINIINNNVDIQKQYLEKYKNKIEDVIKKLSNDDYSSLYNNINKIRDENIRNKFIEISKKYNISAYNHEILHQMLSTYITKGDLEKVKYYIENAKDIDINMDDLLVWAHQTGQLEIFKYLVEKGADIHVYNDFIFRGAIYNLEEIKYLVQQGCDISKINLSDVTNKNVKEFLQKELEKQNKK